MKEIKVFSPATVANLAVGFDILGLALNQPGEEIYIKKIDKREVIINHLDNFNLPTNPKENVAGKVALEIIKHLGLDFGFEITLNKQIHPGSGIGSSSASASGTAYGINQLLERHLTTPKLLHFAMEGEYVASKSYHGDNIFPAFLGGIILIKNYSPIEFVKLPVPDDLMMVIISPQITIKTAESRAALNKTVSLKDTVNQSKYLASFISALYLSDYQQIKFSLQDILIEPQRKKFIPNFDVFKNESISAGALGTGISGSGPSIFSMVKGKEMAEKIENIFKQIGENSPFEFTTFISEINLEGVKIFG